MLLKQGAELLLICFPGLIKRFALHHTFLIIDDKILSLLFYLYTLKFTYIYLYKYNFTCLLICTTY